MLVSNHKPLKTRNPPFLEEGEGTFFTAPQLATRLVEGVLPGQQQWALCLGTELEKRKKKSGVSMSLSVPLEHSHPKTLFEMTMALSLNSGSFPSNLHVSATFSFSIHSGKFWNLGILNKL